MTPKAHLDLVTLTKLHSMHRQLEAQNECSWEKGWKVNYIDSNMNDQVKDRQKNRNKIHLTQYYANKIFNSI